ncbi:MAG TPA: energy transducer TonB [Bryobacteraceae bacterium]|nr:energy transducer TonB [Bryobacteraceae bacterium]
MSFRRFGFAIAASLVSQAAIVAQAPLQPPVPSDPLELVTGEAHPVQDADQRAAATNLLLNARALSNVREYAYDLKTTFVSFGSSEGNWSLEDASPSRGIYRWTAQGPTYSAVNLFHDRMVYSNQPAGVIPLRLAQVRTAIFFAYPQAGPYASLRTAAGSLNGVEVRCVLVSHIPQNKTATGGRLWDESEYCVDPSSGLLMSYSPVPGMYVSYDYSQALHFHDKVIANKFTITQAGQTIVEARTESVTDPGNLEPAVFQPNGLEKVGVGNLMSQPWRISTRVSSSRGKASDPIQAVILEGMLDPDGRLSELRVLASSNAGLNQSAQERAAKWKSWGSQEDGQPGATPQSHEVFFTVEFVPR